MDVSRLLLAALGVAVGVITFFVRKLVFAVEGIKSDAEILAVINGKYVSTKEMNLITADLKERLDYLKGEIWRLRDSNHELIRKVAAFEENNGRQH